MSQGGNEPESTPGEGGLRPVRESRFLGHQLGDVVIEDVIARGGMGVVFRGRHVHSRAAVALKVLLGGSQARDLHRQRFEREAEVIAALRHPDIITVHDAGVEHGHPWIALEYVEGGTLEDQLDRLEQRELVAQIARVARAVGFAHQRGVIHRDLKPSNILIRAETQAPVVTDFGLARDLTQASDLTRSGTTLGTPVYMAPEQAMGRRASPETDVYALGAILYEGLTGQPPFDAGDGVFALYLAIENQRPRPPSAFGPVPRRLEAIVLRALEKRPSDRFPDAGALAEALEDWLTGDAPGGSRALAIALGAAALLLAVVLGAVALRSGPPDPAVASSAPIPPPTSPAEPPAGPPAVERQTLVVRPGPVDGVDATVRNDGLYANDNFGSSPVLLLGDRQAQQGDFRSFLRLETLGLPPGAVLVRATLELSITSNKLARPIQVVAHQVVATPGPGGSRTPWVEGASGRDRFLDGICWAGDLPRAAFPTGRSRQPQFTQPNVALGLPLDEAQVRPRQQGELRFNLTEAVRSWLATPTSNHGIRLAHTREGSPWNDGLLSLASSDHRDERRRPRWTLVYDGAAPTPRPTSEHLMAKAREEVRPLLVAVAAARQADERARALAQRACVLAPFLGEAYFHRARLTALAYRDSATWVDFNLADQASEPYRTAELYLLRGRELLRLGHAAQALQDARRAAQAGAERDARALELAARRRLQRR